MNDGNGESCSHSAYAGANTAAPPASAADVGIAGGALTIVVVSSTPGPARANTWQPIGQWFGDVDVAVGDVEIDGRPVGQRQGGVVDPFADRNPTARADDHRRRAPRAAAGRAVSAFEDLDDAAQRLRMGVVVGALVVPVEGFGAERFRSAPQRVEVSVAGLLVSDPPRLDAVAEIGSNAGRLRSVSVANEQMRDQWTNRTGPAWFANHDIFKAVFRAGVERRDRRRRIRWPERVVLDVGCGTGALSRLVADRGGTPVGADISATMIEGARQIYPELRFEVVDVQEADLAALAPERLRRGGVGVRGDVLRRPDRRLRQHRRGDAATGAAGVRLLAIAGRELRCSRSAPTCSPSGCQSRPRPRTPHQPGPMAFADRDYLQRVLDAAGWVDIDIAPLDVNLRFGTDGSDGVEERLAVILSGSTGALAAEQLRPALGDARWEALLDDVRDELRTSIVDGAVQFPGCIWIVRAAAPE